jgi:hypothetical protein
VQEKTYPNVLATGGTLVGQNISATPFSTLMLWRVAVIEVRNRGVHTTQSAQGNLLARVPAAG